MNQINNLDSENMFETISNYSLHIEDCIQICEIALKFITVKTIKKIDKVLVFGMGGSAIGADLVKSYLKMSGLGSNIEIRICRNYDDSFIADGTFVIASSYSGNTEETLYSLVNALKYTNNILVITTGGKIEELANKNNLALIRLPKGFQPRAAIAYSFFSVLKFFVQFGNIPTEKIDSIKNDIEKSSDFIKNLTPKLINQNSSSAFEIASKFKGKIPIIFSNSEYMEAINLRWRAQIQENAKNLVFGGFLPEMNHNEVNSFKHPSNLLNQLIVVFLKDITDNRRVSIRFDAIKGIFEEMNIEVLEIQSDEESPLLRLLELIHLGDWISYYLSLLNNEDPTPIPLILKLKAILEEKK